MIAAQHVDSPVKWRSSAGHALPSTPDDAAQAAKMNVDGDVKRSNALISLPSSASGNVNASASAVSASKSSPQPQRQSFAELMSEFHNLMAELQADEQSTAVDGTAVRAPAQSAQYMSVADLYTHHSDHDYDHDHTRGQEQPVPTPYDELLRQERERVDREKRLGGALSVDALSQLHDEDVVNKMRGSRSQSGGLNSASTPLYLDDFRREMQKISHLYVFGGDSARSPFAASLGASAASHSSSHSATTPSQHDAKAADRRERQRHDRGDDDDDVMGFDHDYDVDGDDNDFDHHDDVDELHGHDSRLLNESHADADSLDGDTIARRPQSTSSSSFSMRKDAASSSSAATTATTPLPPRTAMPTGSIFVTTDEKQVLRTTNEALLNALRELEREKKSLADKLRTAEVSECGGHDDDNVIIIVMVIMMMVFSDAVW